jgi:hypothetical protein
MTAACEGALIDLRLNHRDDPLKAVMMSVLAI